MSFHAVTENEKNFVLFFCAEIIIVLQVTGKFYTTTIHSFALIGIMKIYKNSNGNVKILLDFKF